MEKFLMSPKVDFALKELMANERVLKGFLSAVLKIKFEDIIEATLLNTNLRKTYVDDKLGIIDVRIRLNSDIEIDIEIQVVEVKAWPERSLFYLSKMFTEQIKKGEDYDVLKKCISISILDFKLFHDTDEFYSLFHLREDNRHSLYTDKMEFHIIELPKLPKTDVENADDLLYWSKFINAKSEEEFKMIATKNPYINEALEELEKISQDEDKRYEYSQREKSLRDYIYLSNKAEAAQKQMEDAQKQMEDAQKQAEAAQKQAEAAQKQADAVQEKLIQAVKNLLELNLSTENISKAINLSIDEIEKIKNSK